MERDDATITLAQALERYFAENDFDATSYTESWARFRVGGVPVIIPNSAQRKAALRRHDLHHVLTGYRTDVGGEAEIGAWEVASGCGRNLVAWNLNLIAMALGLVRAPRRAWRAFVRGRHARNLYHDRAEPDMSRSVADMRRELALSEDPADVPAATAADVAVFAGATVASLWTGLVALVTFPVVTPIFWVAWALTARRREVAA
jgi:hypothetical protein